MPTNVHLTKLFLCWVMVCVGLNESAAFGLAAQSERGLSNRPRLAILHFALGVDIANLSAIRTVTAEIPPDEEASLVADAIRAILDDARQLFYDQLTSGAQFELIPLAQTDMVIQNLGLEPGGILSQEQLANLKTHLGADVVVIGTLLDYGKVRWQWLAGGMGMDMTWESLAIGAATAWNPIAILANIGFELATSTPLWFGGGYLFGVACRPVRVEAQAVETILGAEVWSDMEVALLARKQLQEFPEEERSKKEVQLQVNLRRAMEALGHSLLNAEITFGSLWEARLPAQAM
jgi:hypothetical protein